MSAPITTTCSNCGSAVPAGDRFCGSCGNPITGSALLSGGSAALYDPWLELLQKLRQATIGEYEIKGELGRGGMAAVFLAHDLHLNRKVAIKVMLPGLAYGERMWERFFAEARTAAKLDHPNIIYIHSVRERDRFIYFVMKYVDGRPLDDILSRSGPLPLPVAQAILVEVARALDYAHREGVVHRDIKPANIMIDSKGNAIVMDFGIARVQDAEHFTQTGSTIGTPAYMSPEQCHGQQATAASDQYSLGVVAYEMLSGSQPFSGSPIELQLAHIQETPKPLSTLRPDVPAELASAVMRTLEKDPARRFPSLTELTRRFAAGYDPGDPAVREAIVALVCSGPPRRQSWQQPTPASPASPVVAGPKSAPAQPRDDTTTPARDGASTSAEDDAVRSAETTAVPAVAADDAHSRPTAAIDSGSQNVARTGSPGLIGLPTSATPAAPARRHRARGVTLGIGAVAVIAAAVVVPRLRSGSIRTRGDSVSADSAQPDRAASAADAVASAMGDSVAIGPGPAASTPARGKALPVVSGDAIGLIAVSLPKGGLAVGDTVVARVELTDDFGARVTSRDLVWTSSNPRVVRFAGAGRLVGVARGSATVSVHAGSTTGSMNVTVAPPRKPPPAGQRPQE